MGATSGESAHSRFGDLHISRFLAFRFFAVTAVLPA
jgi:hypothetical protein